MLELLLAELIRTGKEFKRYPVDAIATVAITTFIFYGLFLGARFVAGPGMPMGDRLDTVVVGYMLWTLALSVVNDIAIGLQVEAQTGTLEQVLLSKFGMSQIFLIRAIASLASRLILILSVLLIILLLTGTRLSFPPVLLLPLSTVLLAAYGLAFLMGALALLFKQVQQLLGIFQFAFLFLLAVPSETWIQPFQPLALLLPMTLGADALRDLMVNNQGLNLSHFFFAACNGVSYFALGWLVFKAAERQTKRQGILNAY